MGVRIVQKLTVVLTVVVASCVVALAAEPAPSFRAESGFAPADGGFVIDAGQGGGRLVSTATYPPGAYLLTGEYKTEGMAPTAMFAVDAQDKSGKVVLSKYDWTCSSPQWAPFFLSVNLSEPSDVYMRVGHWKGCKGAESKLCLRGLKMVKQTWTEGENLLVNGDQARSTPGYLPPTWYWKLAGNRKNGWPANGAVVAKNTSFKGSDVANVLAMACPGNKAEIMLNSRSLNLPPKGDLELTFWAKADKPCVIRPRIVQSWSGMYTNTPIAIGTDWTKVSVNYHIIPSKTRKYLFVRLDMPKEDAAKIEFADLKLIWRENHKGVDGPIAKKPPRPRKTAPKEPALPPFDPKNLPSVARSPREYLVGLNIAGGEFRGKDPTYGWPSNETLDYFASKGFKLIRLPFMWERIQPELGKPLEPGYAKELVRVIEEIGKRDMVVLLDLHNYAKYDGKGVDQGGFTYEQFGDTWERIAKLVTPCRKYIWAYGLMNEPHITGPQKIPFWQSAIDAIRKVDQKTPITVSGEALKSESNPKQFHLKDPARAIIYESHFYFDHPGSGKYANTYEEEINRSHPRVGPMVGVDRIKKFIAACEKYNVRCLIGEYGAPAGDGVDPRWLDAMDNALKYMHEHRITSTYWAAGDYWTRRGTSYVIGKNGWKPGEHDGEERPQTKILKKYIKLAGQDVSAGKAKQ